ncbi:hypothetical protein [Streptomyces sp. NPDC006645]|uniref:hypothetical protein n=1 Tax=unclassified Streptomyces TaxID=2593676 RepID=UPI0033A78FA2
MHASPAPGNPLPPMSTDPPGHYVYGRRLLDLTDRLNGAESYALAADLVEEILDPVDGALERLADFFEAAGEKARESDADDGFDLAQDFEEAAVDIRRLNEDLHLAVDRMLTLTTPRSEPAVRLTYPATTAVPMPPTPAGTPGRHR